MSRAFEQLSFEKAALLSVGRSKFREIFCESFGMTVLSSAASRSAVLAVNGNP
jgi:hypothetical protein